MIVRVLVALLAATLLHFAVGCGDPCVDADYTTSGICMNLDGYKLAREDVDFVVQTISQVANRHGLHHVNMAQHLKEIGPVPVVMVPYASLGSNEDGMIGGCTHYQAIVPWANTRVSGYNIELMDGVEYDNQLRLLAHELLHIMGPDYLNTSPEMNADHSEPYMFMYWVHYDHDYGVRNTVEGLSYYYIRQRLGLE